MQFKSLELPASKMTRTQRQVYAEKKNGRLPRACHAVKDDGLPCGCHSVTEDVFCRAHLAQGFGLFTLAVLKVYQ